MTGLTKEELRHQMRARRRAQEPGEAARLSQRIIRTCLGQLPLSDIECLALYWPVRGEVDPRGLAGSEVLEGVTLALPVVAGRDAALSFRSWKPGVPMEAGAFGIDVPASGVEVRPDVVLVPLLGFDRAGYRLGQGGGFYDRTLESLRKSGGSCEAVLAVGLAFSFQECFNLPHEPHDQRLDRVVTELDMIVI